jgi:hypothetical protein
MEASQAGQGTSSFAGLLPMLNSFDSLQNKFADDSQFMTSVTSLLDQTAEIDRAVYVASSSLSLLSNATLDSDNKDPKNSFGVSLLHKNMLAEAVSTLLTPAIQALDDSVGKALANLRSEIASHLGSAKRKELQDTLSRTVGPLQELKQKLRDGMEYLLPSESSEGVWQHRKWGLSTLLFVLSAYALLITLFAGLSMWCCMKRPLRKADEAYNPHVHRLACCSWCCGCCFSTVALFLGGIMLVTASLLSGTCLLLEDANSGVVQDIGPALGLNMTGDTGLMLGDIVDSCLNPSSDNASQAYLADLLFVRGFNNSKVTLRQKLNSEFKTEIDDNFAIITAKLNLNLPSLVSDPRLVALRKALKDNPADKMIIADSTALSASSMYNPLLDVASAATVGFSSSAACSSHTVSAGISGFSVGQEVPGIAAFMAELQGMGDGTETAVAAPSCAKHVGCHAGAANESACIAGNALITLKAELQGLNGHEPYQCDLFESTTGSGGYCDPSGMVQVAGTSPAEYTGDCVSAAGTMTPKARTCDLANFTAYLADFEDRIKIAFERLDSTTAGVQGLLNDNLRQLLYQDLLSETSSLVEEASCAFITTHYTRTLDGFCYLALHGWWRLAANAVGLAVFQLLLVLPMYVVWRVSRDNVAMDSEAAATVREIVAARKMRGEQPEMNFRHTSDKAGFCTVCGQ